MFAIIILHSRRERNPKLRKLIRKKLLEHLERAETLKQNIGLTHDDKLNLGEKDHRDDDDDDGAEDTEEQIKMKGQLSDAIMKEKPNV